VVLLRVQYANLFVCATAEAKDEKFMSSSGLEATQQELDAFGDDGGIEDDDEDDEDSDE
jgi:translation initiation factor eIF-2B subunit gamma